MQNIGTICTVVMVVAWAKHRKWNLFNDGQRSGRHFLQRICCGERSRLATCSFLVPSDQSHKCLSIPRPPITLVGYSGIFIILVSLHYIWSVLLCLYLLSVFFNRMSGQLARTLTNFEVLQLTIGQTSNGLKFG